MATFDRDGKKNEVRERTNIVEIVRRSVELKRKGPHSFAGLCPFHAEKTPSFYVNEQHGYFNCFGCGEKGDVFTFLMKIDGRGFKEVLADLAQAAGIELDTRPLTEAEKRARAAAESERERMLRATEMAVAFFQKQYAGPGGAAARAYVESRGISPRIVESFRIGWAPDDWHALERHLAAEKVPAQVAERLGLMGAKDGRNFDLFRGRVMLPVIDKRKRPVGFSSRLLDPDAKERKYVNSSDSDLFHKKAQLYGIHAAQDAIRKSGTAVVVEGNFDVLALHEAGIEEAVAPMGTALTAEQVGLLRPMADKRIVVVFDGDEAGKRAAQKAIPLFVDADVDGRVAHMPPGMDPDDFVRKQGADAFRRLLDAARPMLDQYIDDLAAASELGTIPGRVRALEEAAPLFARVKNPTVRELYAGRLATTLQLAPAMVARALRAASARTEGAGRRTGGEAPDAVAPPATAVVARTPPRDELEVLALLHAHPAVAASPDMMRVVELVSDLGLKPVLRTAAEAGARLDVPALIEACPADIRDAVLRTLADDGYAEAPAPDRVLSALRSRLERARLDAELGMMRRQHREALARGDEATARALSVRELELIRTKQGLTEAPARP